MDEITETGRSKADFVADVLNKTLYTLITTCSKAEGVRSYFDVGVIAYGGKEVASGFDPKSVGGTPMRAALDKTRETVAEWCEAHPASYPPTVLHVTDGQSTDGTPEEMADALRRIATKDGQALLFNLHVTSQGGPEILFPT